MQEITRLSAGQLADGMRRGKFRCVEVMRAFLDRIDTHNARVNAIVQLDPHGAMAAAEKADRDREAGLPLGPLFGVPYAVKDGFDAAGFATTYGAAALRNNRVDTDHCHVARMKSAGAIVIGKTNMPEFAFGEDTDNALWGRTRNPYCLDRSPGSSSGGAGAALALDLVPLADGSDLGGSLRIPAAWCNTVGIRPSVGVVPAAPCKAPYDRLHVIGPMARRVDDIRLALSVMAGTDPRSPFVSPVAQDAFDTPLTGDLSGLRIAFSVGKSAFDIDPAVTAALAPCAEVLEQAGATVEGADPNVAFVARGQTVFRAICAADHAGWAADEYGLRLGHTILDLVGQSRRLTGLQIERAKAAQTKGWARLRSFFDSFDLIVWPTTSGPPFFAKDAVEDGYDWGTLLVSPALDLPSVSVPGGMLSGGLPVGLQIIGPPGSDRMVLEAAEAIERGLAVWEKNPPRTDLELV